MNAENNSPVEGTENPRGQRKSRVGVVVSDRGDKTVVVKVERRFAHPLYGKQVTRTKKYHAHDENNEFHVGDTVRITETRPLSKLKRWRVSELVERAR
jgi:small subunit ribosomal protein S17